MYEIRMKSSLSMISFVLGVLSLLVGSCECFVAPSSSSSLGSPYHQKSTNANKKNLVNFDNHISKHKKKKMELNIWGNRGNEDEGLELRSDRIKACIPYILPLIDGDLFGKYFYQRIPILGTLDDIFLAPLVTSIHGVPFLDIILFLVISLGTTRNYDLSRALRFNAQQAVMIDVALIVPSLLKDGIVDPETGELYIPQTFVEPFFTTVYYVYMACIIYSIYSNLSGKKPSQIPYLSNLAEMTTGPF